MGTGVVRSAHGNLPVPGPATLEVLRGSRVRWTEEPRETTTPTGASLMAAFTGGRFTDAAPPMTLLSVGYGAGRASLEHAPNLLRVVTRHSRGVTVASLACVGPRVGWVIGIVASTRGLERVQNRPDDPASHALQLLNRMKRV